MATSTSQAAEQKLREHEQAVDTLHQHLSALPGANREKLEHVVGAYKAAVSKFHGDALGCMN